MGRAGSRRLVARLSDRRGQSRSSASGTNASRDQAIGLSGQMHGAVLLDAAGAVVRPSIIWCDQRTDTECRWIEPTVGASRAARAHVQSGAHQLHADEAALGSRARTASSGRASATCCCQRTTSAWRMSGEHRDRRRRRVRHADARRRAAGAWSADLLDRVGIDAPTAAARVRDRRTSAPACRRRRRARSASRWVRRSSPAQAIRQLAPWGWGSRGRARSARQSARPASSSLPPIGRSRDPKGRLHTFCHAVPGRWHVMGVTQAAGLSLRWLRDLVGATGGVTYDDLTARSGARGRRAPRACCGRRI